MAKFSVDGEEDGEETRGSRSKRPRLSSTSSSSSSLPQQFTPQIEEEGDAGYEDQTDDGDDDDDEEEEEDDDCDNEEEEYDEEEEQEEVEDDDNEMEEPNRNGSISVTLADPEVLDCSICYEPLTIPVFQCENGHTACSSCCNKIAHKCPSCSMPIGYNRCRAIEKVLESVKISCPNTKYGCKEVINYSKKSDHQKICAYAPCSCPLSGCNFLGSPKRLYQHVSVKHVGSVIRFSHDRTFPVFFTDKDKFLLLQEEKDGVLFILSNIAEHLGNMVMVSCLESSPVKGQYLYDLTAKIEGSNIRYQSFTKNVLCRVDKPPLAGFVMVPRDFFGSYGQITLDLRIWRHGTSRMMASYGAV